MRPLNKPIRAYGFDTGGVPGLRNLITDVPGVTVGHCTIDTDRCKTGVTVILPCQDNMFRRKLTAAAFVHNGFGKTAGIPQIDELGTLETPIALTNTLNVGKVHDAIVGWMLDLCRQDGTPIRSVNPVVGETNDGVLSDIALRPVEERHVRAAIESASADFAQGDVGAGKGTVCFGMKGGIGSASRLVTVGEKTYTLGVLVQSNFGATANFTLCGRDLGPGLARRIEAMENDQGSIMMVVATDLPLSSRQLRRVIRRCGVGLSRTGSYMGHGSGDVMLGFTTANRIEPEGDTQTVTILREGLLSAVFTACAQATEEAILNSLACADTVTGYDGKTKRSLTELYLSTL
ncbi:MAG: P1 family peptidase [Ruminococcaceae bacterium]|jgi:D-aminopeptidase|nr:P1 family peptidase [Oscillospiraceae bacterium]